MNILTYLLIGTLFMGSVEYILSLDSVRSHLSDIPELGGVERAIGILFWPICLGIFLYNFIKNLLK